MSQIGYMIMGVGVGAFSGGVFHFLTHAFFKAQLFLGAGIIIHALANEQDVRRMGGLRTRMPFAFFAMLVGVLAICGVPGFSGFFSKDDVIYGTLAAGHPWLYAVGVLTAGITAYYMFRLLFVTFFGAYRGDVDAAALGIAAEPFGAGASGHRAEQAEPHHQAQSGLMNVPVAILIVPTIFIGWLDFGEGSPWKQFFRGFPGFDAAATSAAMPELASTGFVLAVVAAGFAIAYARYGSAAARRDAIARLRTEALGMPPVLVHAYYVDAAYEFVFARSARALGGWFDRVVDPQVIDAGVREVAISSEWLGHLFRSFQTGLVRTYALTLVFGVACFVAYYALAFGVSR
jgi:NADH-quinone oxidoreductase subunit L